MILLPKTFWEIKETKHKGKGIFAKKKISKGTIIGDYLGTLTKFIDVDLQRDGNYIMQYDNHFCIVPDRSCDGAHLLNHSCSPNTWMYPYQKHTLFIAIKDIAPHEEITIHYLYPPLSEGCKDCSHVCQCKSGFCTGTMHTEEALYTKWRNFYDNHIDKHKNSKVKPGMEFLPFTAYPATLSLDEFFQK